MSNDLFRELAASLAAQSVAVRFGVRRVDADNPAPTEPDCRPDRTGLDDGPYLPGHEPRKKSAQKSPEDLRAIRLAAWETRRAKWGPRGHR